MPPAEVATIAPSVPSRQGRALLARLRDDEVLRAYLGNRIRVVHSEEAADEAGEAAPELLLWLEASEEERLPSGFAELTTHWRLRLVLAQMGTAEAGDPWWRADLIEHIKGVVVVGDLRDEDSEIVAEYLIRFERIDSARRTTGNAALRSAIGFALTKEITETTREAA